MKSIHIANNILFTQYTKYMINFVHFLKLKHFFIQIWIQFHEMDLWINISQDRSIFFIVWIFIILNKFRITIE